MTLLTPPVFGDADQLRGMARGWSLLGSLPVPIRPWVRDRIGALVAARGEAGRGMKCCVPMGQGGHGPFERLRFIRQLEAFPDMLVSAEWGNAFNRAFHARHVETGAFAGCQPAAVAPAFAEAELVDPQGWIGVYGVAPFVLLLDHQRLDGLPPPRRWADLLEPDYRGQVVFSGWRRGGSGPYTHLNLFFLLAMMREFGTEGLSRLLRNVPALLHSTQMPRLAGTGSSPGGIYVLPWSLAALCPRRDHTEVVWPEDGALAFPLWLTVKEARRRRLDFLVDYFHGDELGAYLSHNRYPVPGPAFQAALPPGAGFKWPGWDFLRHRRTAGLIKTARALAAEALEGGTCG